MESHDASVHPENKLFGRALSEICQKDGCPPKPIMVRIVWMNVHILCMLF